MLETKLKLVELVRRAEQEVVRLDYSEESIRKKKTGWKRFISYSKDHGEDFFSSELAILFLKEFYNYPDAEKKRHSTHVNGVANSIRKLSDLNLYGRFLAREKKKLIHSFGAFADSIKVYEEYCIRRNNQEDTIYRNKKILDAFFEYLLQVKVTRPQEITPLLLSQYASSQLGYSKKTFESRIAALRGYFRSLYFAGIIETDLSKRVPVLRFPQLDRAPTIWKSEDIDKLINSIDRGNPYGKRDYAIILLVVTYGLRDGDVRKLKLENIKWEANAIRFTQSKTGQDLSLPLSEKIGLAIIDYLKHGRPVSDNNCVFLKHTAPYDGMEKAGNVITKYIKISHIPIDESKKHGIHTLRHTLASRLLEHDVSLNDIAAILGHIDPNSSKTYMHLAIEKLRACALELGD